MSTTGRARPSTVLTRADGSTFGLFDATAEAGPEAGPEAAAARVRPVIVMSPAMGMPASYYATFLAALAQAGMHGLAYEQRGHEVGGEPAGWHRDFRYADLVDDLAQTVDEARRRHPGSPVIVLGHSLGGQVAIAASGARPGLFDGLILMASSTPHWRHWSPKVLVAAYAFPALARVLGHFPGDKLRFAGREARGMISEWARLARTGRLPLGEDGLAEVEMPLLAVSIEGDWLGVPSAVDALCAKVPRCTPERVHVTQPTINHFTWARTPDSVMPAVTAWVDLLAVP